MTTNSTPNAAGPTGWQRPVPVDLHRTEAVSRPPLSPADMASFAQQHREYDPAARLQAERRRAARELILRSQQLLDAEKAKGGQPTGEDTLSVWRRMVQNPRPRSW